MPMLVARQERTLAVDGEWVHVCSPSPVLSMARFNNTFYRLCHPVTKPETFLIVAEHRPTMSRRSRTVSNRQSPRQLSSWSSLVEGAHPSGMILRLRIPRWLLRLCKRSKVSRLPWKDLVLSTSHEEVDKLCSQYPCICR